MGDVSIMGWLGRTPEEKAARHARSSPRLDAARARVEQQRATKAVQQELQQYIKDRKAERLFSFADVHVFPDCIVRTSDDYAGTYSLKGISARVEESGQLSSHGTLPRAAVAPGWQKTVNTHSTRMVIDGPEFQWIIPLKVSVGDPFGKAAKLTTLGRTAS